MNHIGIYTNVKAVFPPKYRIWRGISRRAMYHVQEKRNRKYGTIKLCKTFNEAVLFILTKYKIKTP